MAVGRAFPENQGGLMKRLMVIAVLCAVVSGVVFAQELKFDGYLNSGMGVVTNDKEGDDAYVKVFGVDSESNGYRFRLNGSYTNETKNVGAKFRLQGQRRMDQSGYLSMPYLYGWMGFFENKLTLTGGLVDDGTWTSADWYWNDDTGEGLGLLLKAEPIKGLNLGVGAYTISQQGSGANNWLSYTPITKKNNSGVITYTADTARLPNFGELTLKPEDVKYTFNAAYTMPDTFRLGAIFRTKNRAGWASGRIDATTGERVDDDKYDYAGREEAMFLQTELRVLAIKDLTAVVVGAFNRLEEFNKRGNMMFSETFGYKMDNLNVGLNAVQFLYNRVDKDDDKIDVDPGLLFNPWVSYTIDKVVPRLDLVYFMGGQSKTANGNNQWERRGFVPQGGAIDAAPWVPSTKKGSLGGVKDKDDDYSVLSFRPSVKINVDSRTFLEIGDIINYDFANFDGAYADKNDAKKKSLLTNVFYVDLKFSF